MIEPDYWGLPATAWERNRESVAELSFRRFILRRCQSTFPMIQARALEIRNLNEGGDRFNFTVKLVKECLAFISKAPRGVKGRLSKALKK